MVAPTPPRQNERTQHDHALAILRAEFPPGTPVRVTEITEDRNGAYQSQIVGVVEAWDEQPTGSWFAHGRKDRLWLPRLKLRKVDGEQSLIVLNGGTRIARLEAASEKDDTGDKSQPKT